MSALSALMPWLLEQRQLRPMADIKSLANFHAAQVLGALSDVDEDKGSEAHVTNGQWEVDVFIRLASYRPADEMSVGEALTDVVGHISPEERAAPVVEINLDDMERRVLPKLTEAPQTPADIAISLKLSPRNAHVRQALSSLAKKNLAQNKRGEGYCIPE